MNNRIILHIDVNNAFLSWTAVDMLKNGSQVDIRKRYAIIGGDETQRRGIVLAKSNPCKQKGVVTAETIRDARRKCPYLEVYKPNFTIYRHYSNLMYHYLLQYTDKIERYSIDECFLDYTSSQKLFGDPIKIAYKIKDDIYKKFGFTVNVGIGKNKLCAKMASDFSKPNKVHTLFPEEIKTKMWPLDVSELFMIGKSTSKKLHELNIHTIGELAQTNQEELIKRFKSNGKLMWEYANGIDYSEVEDSYVNPKSISSSTVLPYNYSDINEIYKVIKNLVTDTGKRLRKNNQYASVVHVSIKYSNFTKISKQVKLDNNINTDEEIYIESLKIFNKLWNEEPIRSIAIGVSGLSTTNNVQLSIFNQTQNKENNDHLQKTIDTIRDKYGNNLITYANVTHLNDRINLKGYKKDDE